MKNLLFGMLAMAAMVSCSSENEPIDDVTGGKQDKVEIKIAAGVLKAETKAPVDGWGEDGKYVQFVKGTASGNYTDDWFAKITGTAGTVQFKDASGELANDKSYYYESDGSDTYLRGFYPQGTNTSGSVTFTIPEAADIDIMVSDEQSGNKTNAFGKFTFGHLLTQIKFSLKAGDGFPSNYVLKSITLKGTKKTATLALKTGQLTFTGADDDKIDIKVIENGTSSISTAATDMDRTVMVQPGVAMTLDIVAGVSGDNTQDRTYTGIPFTTKGGEGTEEEAKAGTAYTVTLTFSDKAVEATAGITPWATGTGEGTVQ